MQSKRQFVFDSPQGLDEAIAYSLDTTGYGAGASAPQVVVYSGIDTAAPDVSGTVLTGSPTLVDGILTFPRFNAPSVGYYRFEVAFDVNGNHVELFGLLQVER